MGLSDGQKNPDSWENSAGVCVVRVWRTLKVECR